MSADKNGPRLHQPATEGRPGLTCIDLPCKPGVTRPKELGPGQSEGRALGEVRQQRGQ